MKQRFKNLISIQLLTLCFLTLNAQESIPANKHISSMFWTWQDKVIEIEDTLRAYILDLKNAGFEGIYAVPRATRSHVYHDEMIDAVKLSSIECQKHNIEFIWGLDPRFLASYVLQETGYGAEMLMVNTDFRLNIPSSREDGNTVFERNVG